MTEEMPELEIRLQRITNRKLPCFRLVVVPAKDHSGRFLEQVGIVNAVNCGAGDGLNLARLRYWLDLGAQPVGDAITAVARIEGTSAA